MKLKKLILENLKGYQGRNEIEIKKDIKADILALEEETQKLEKEILE